MQNDKLELQRERDNIQQKLRETHSFMVSQIERKRFLGLDTQVRQIQKQVSLLSRI